MIRVFSEATDLDAVSSMRLSSRKRSSGAISSGLNLIWNDAFAGQISVTPLIRLSRTPLVIDRPLKNACSDISSSHSTKMCSSPPKEYLVFIAPPLFVTRQVLRNVSQATAQETVYQIARPEHRDPMPERDAGRVLSSLRQFSIRPALVPCA